MTVTLHSQSWLDSVASTPGGSIAVSLLLLAGTFSGLRALYRFCNGIYIYFIRPGKNLKRLGQWAVITGATDGIGKAYAFALAKKGINIVLISRTQSRLDEAAKEIGTKYNVKTKTLAVDFGKADAGTWSTLKAELAPLQVGILVNNVGVSYPYAEYYESIDDQLIDDLVTINIQATNKMTRIVLPGMKERRRGAIVNIGSAAATVAPSGPLYCVYAGTKAYVDMFSKSLDLEYKQYGISVHNQAPAYVATKMSKIRKPTMDAPSPADWVAAAVKHIGYEPTQCPFPYHGAMWGLISSAPEWIVNEYLLGFNQMLRKKYFKKMEREAAKAKGQ